MEGKPVTRRRETWEATVARVGRWDYRIELRNNWGERIYTFAFGREHAVRKARRMLATQNRKAVYRNDVWFVREDAK